MNWKSGIVLGAALAALIAIAAPARAQQTIIDE
jgi:hypothetical protein